MKMINALKKLSIVALCVITVVLCLPFNSKAATTCIIRAPFNGTVVVAGKTLTDADLCDYGYMDGRIQRIAAEKYAVVYKYKDYQVTVNNINDIAVYDANNQLLTYTVRQGAILDYTSNSDAAFMQANEATIKNAAIAFHNRVGGYDSTQFGSYFLSGSDAYIKGVGSDAGRKWGQYMRAQKINSVVVSDLFIYSADTFSARVDINASGSGVENYAIYLLFKNVNGKYYVTHFTYQD